MSKPRLLIDWDKTCVEYHGWEKSKDKIEPLLPGTIKFLKKLSKHFNLCIFSTRFSAESNGKKYAEKWKSVIKIFLEKNGVPIEQCTAEKIPSFAIIDDRAIQFDGNWESVNEILMNRLKKEK